MVPSGDSAMMVRDTSTQPSYDTFIDISHASPRPLRIATVCGKDNLRQAIKNINVAKGATVRFLPDQSPPLLQMAYAVAPLLLLYISPLSSGALINVLPTNLLLFVRSFLVNRGAVSSVWLG